MLRKCLAFALIVTASREDSPSQDRLIAFGPRIERRLAVPAASVAIVATRSGKPLIAAAAEHAGQVNTFRVSPEGVITKATSLKTSFSGSMMVSGDSPHTNEEVSIFSPARSSMDILNVESGLVRNIPLPSEPEANRIRMFDIDNDSRKDLLFYGKEQIGIRMFRGRRGEGYDKPTYLFPELSVSDLEILDLNGDEIADFFVLDWLSNEIVYYSGIGRGIFSEQISLRLPSEPADMALGTDPAGRGALLAVTVPDLAEVRLYSVNTLGEFRLLATGTSPEATKEVKLVDVNDDGLRDVITTTESTILVFFGLPTGGLSKPSSFSVGGRLSSWSIGDVDGDSRTDVVFLDRKSQLLCVLGNGNRSSSLNWPRVYTVGLLPGGISTGDFDNDGFVDIAVVSSKSSALSVLMNRGNGSMNGQSSVSLSANPVSVRLATMKPGGLPVFLVSHESPNLVSVVDLFDEGTNPVLTVPTGPVPHVLGGEISGSDRRLTFLARSGRKDGNLSLSFFDKISSDQFVETTLMPNIPGRITAITGFDLNSDGIKDICFAMTDGKTGAGGLFVSYGKGRMGFDAPRKLVEIQNPEIVVRSIIPGSYDRDHMGDLLVLPGPPWRGVGILHAENIGTIDSLTWIGDVAVPHEDAVLFKDLNRDGRNDLCCLDTMTGSVVAYYGLAPRGFGPKIGICSAPDAGAIAASPLRNEREMDLIITHKLKGTVEIVENPF
jgi:hypothetical protein